MSETDIEYVKNPKAAYPILNEMYVEKGDVEDWNLLSDLHYKSHVLPVGAAHWRLVFRGETIGVCVISISKGLLKERHILFPQSKPGQDSQLTNIHRYTWVNQNFKVVGRFVIDTMFRSGGVAYRFLNIACRMQTSIRFLEIQSSMAAYNPFAQKAGFVMVEPQRATSYDSGMKFMRMWFESHPSDIESLMEEFNQMSPKAQVNCNNAMKAFYHKNSSLEKTGGRRTYGDKIVEKWDARRTITKMQGLCFAAPVYGIYENPDHNRSLPDKIFISEFDRQPITAPLLIGTEK